MPEDLIEGEISLLPDFGKREKILELMAKIIVMDPSVDFKKVARRTFGFSGSRFGKSSNWHCMLQETIRILWSGFKIFEEVAR